MNNYCLPIIAEDPDTVRRTIESAADKFGFFEIWLDYLQSGHEELVSDLSSSLGSQVVFVLRRKELEAPTLDFERRKELIAQIASLPALLDLDIASQIDEIEYLKSLPHTPAIILSYHNYKETPSIDRLEEICEKMESVPESITKIATFCATERDAVRLLDLQLSLKKKFRRHIVLGMGKHGAVTRIFCTLWGNQMIFAPESRKEASAPGQLTRVELEDCFRVLSNVDD